LRYNSFALNEDCMVRYNTLVTMGYVLNTLRYARESFRDDVPL